MHNYYRSTRTQKGRYAHKRMDWAKLVNDAFNFTVAVWVGVTVIDIILKAHGL